MYETCDKVPKSYTCIFRQICIIRVGFGIQRIKIKTWEKHTNQILSTYN